MTMLGRDPTIESAGFAPKVPMSIVHVIVAVFMDGSITDRGGSAVNRSLS